LAKCLQNSVAVVASGDGGDQSQRLQRGPGDHMALGEWSGAEGPTVFVDLTPGL
jgi:hypothetical protein